MAIITVRVDDDLKKRMEHLKEVNWSEVARRAIEEKVREAEYLATCQLFSAKGGISRHRFVEEKHSRLE